ncbi:MAG: hypothetical protein ABR927_08500 [Bacteroidales bacterium]|jgi:hypothetical protein
MKKLLLYLFVAVFSLAQLAAQESTFKQGDKVLNLGIGLGSTLYTGSYYTSSVPPISASLEFGVKDGILDKGSIGVGGYLGYSSHKWEYDNWGYKYSNFIIGARGVFHYPLVNKLDTYTGILLGYDIASSKEFGTAIYGYDYSASTGGLVGAWFVGARYYFSSKFAVMAELGYGITYLNIGVALKL